ncbi:MAG: hypothetical protein KF819_39540, partial [Labilithrix sp.]|nr:hypothetical protein [Labilithrix sp.]
MSSWIGDVPHGLKAVVLLTGGMAAALIGHAIASGETAVSRLYERYVRRLDQSLRLLFMPESGRRIARIQIAAIGVVLGAHATLNVEMWWIAV